jgi:hypothetical protein
MTEDFSHSKMEYKKDEQGKEILLKDGKFQVMMEWEKPYMQACIDALKPFGDVLEIGFGLAYSAEHIQTYRPKSHTIIEYHPDVAARARQWAKRYPNVTIVEGTWQSELPKLGMFDCIFFDDYPLQSEQQMQKMEQESSQSELLLKKGQKLLQEVEKTIPFLTEIKYSDHDLKELMSEVPLKEMVHVQHFIRFLGELAERGQISAEQFQNMLNQFVRDKKITKEEIERLLKKKETKAPFSFSGPNDRLYTFLSQCLKNHMRKGSRFSCFLSSAASKFEDEKFFNEIITNPYLDFHEEEISLEVPENCAYFSGNKALVITIEKMG